MFKIFSISVISGVWMKYQAAFAFSRYHESIHTSNANYNLTDRCYKIKLKTSISILIRFVESYVEQEFQKIWTNLQNSLNGFQALWCYGLCQIISISHKNQSWNIFYLSGTIGEYLSYAANLHLQVGFVSIWKAHFKNTKKYPKHTYHQVRSRSQTYTEVSPDKLTRIERNCSKNLCWRKLREIWRIRIATYFKHNFEVVT